MKLKEKQAKQEAKESGVADDLNSEFKTNVVEESSNKEKLTQTMLHIEEELFESVSKRAWTDLLLQLIKVCYHT